MDCESLTPTQVATQQSVDCESLTPTQLWPTSTGGGVAYKSEETPPPGLGPLSRLSSWVLLQWMHTQHAWWSVGATSHRVLTKTLAVRRAHNRVWTGVHQSAGEVFPCRVEEQLETFAVPLLLGGRTVACIVYCRSCFPSIFAPRHFFASGDGPSSITTGKEGEESAE